MDPTTISSVIKQAANAAGIKFTSHDLDRTFADTWARTETQQVLSKLTRRTPKVLEKYYAKLDAQSISRAMMLR